MVHDRWLWRPGRKELEREIDEEVAFHLEMRALDLQHEGRDPGSAAQEARARFGDAKSYRRELLAIRSAQVRRRERTLLWNELVQDVRFGIRQQLRKPALPLLIMALMVVGVGTATAIFSVVQAVLLRPLPFPGPDGLVYLLESRKGYSRLPAAYPNFEDWRAESTSFDDLAGFTPWYFSLQGDQGADRVLGSLVTAGAFEILGVKPALGRTFGPGEDRPGATQVVVLSHGLWARSFGADPELLGTPIPVNGEPHTVIGIMPAGFQVPRPWMVGEKEELWTPLAASPDLQPMLSARGTHGLGVLGRLRGDVSRAMAQQEMSLIADRLAAQYPDSNTGAGVRVVSVHEELVGEVDRKLLMLFAGSGLMLLVVCANVAGLLMARAMARQPEVAMRSALGAGRLRLVRQFLTENLALCLLAGGLAFLLARWGVTSLRAVLPTDIPRVGTVNVDWSFLVVALAASTATGLVFSMAPAWVSARAACSDLLRGARGTARVGPGRPWLRNALVVAQISIALVLANAAALMLSSYVSLLDKDYGFEPGGALTMRVSLEGQDWEAQSTIRSFYEQVLERVRNLPGVESAAATSKLPLEGGTNSSLVQADGHVFETEKGPPVEIMVVTEDYFRAMGIPLVAGRTFTPSDFAATAPFPAVINTRMAEALWPNGDAIGKSFSFELPHQWTVIGVVADVPQFGAERRAIAEAYLTCSANPPAPVFSMSTIRYLVVGGSVEPTSLAASIRAQVAQVAPDQPVSDIRSTARILGGALAQRRFQTLLVGLFAAVAVILMASGVFGVTTFFVAERTAEFGIRRALGASDSSLYGTVLYQSTRITGAGIAIGLAGVFVTAQLTRAMVHGVSPTDPASLIACCLALGIIALSASLVPAHRATRVDPNAALRER